MHMRKTGNTKKDLNVTLHIAFKGYHGFLI